MYPKYINSFSYEKSYKTYTFLYLTYEIHIKMKDSYLPVPDTIQYNKLPKEVEEILEQTIEEITEESRITFDGRQYLVRFPNEISRLYGITHEKRVVFRLKRPSPNMKIETILEIKII